jgi:hypothetical protein
MPHTKMTALRAALEQLARPEAAPAGIGRPRRVWEVYRTIEISINPKTAEKQVFFRRQKWAIRPEIAELVG